jgi:inner membrane protein
MPSLLGHAAAGLALNAAVTDGRAPRRTWALAAACAMAPDLDWFTAFLHLPYGHCLTHRGATHSLAAAALIASAAMLLSLRPHLRNPRLWLCLFAAAFSHGLLDACTLGGVGVAAFLPFSGERYVCVWQPIRVSPIPLSGRLWIRFLGALWTEAVWIGLPAILLVTGTRAARLRAAGRWGGPAPEHP